MEKNINYESLLNTIINTRKEIISLKNDLNDIKSEHKVYDSCFMIHVSLMISLEKSHYQLVLNLCDLAIKLY